MCIVFVAIGQHPRYDLVLASNRDEYVDRATDALHRWPGRNIIAGRDARAGGTWLAAAADRPRWGALTNVAGGQAPRRIGAASRGTIVTDWLEAQGDASPFEYCASLLVGTADMAGYNGLLGDLTPLGRCRVSHVTNRGDGGVSELGDGVHGLANDVCCNTEGAVAHGRARLQQELTQAPADIEADELASRLFSMLEDPAYYIPEAGYCTRSSSVLLVEGAARSSTLLELDRLEPAPVRKVRSDWSRWCAPPGTGIAGVPSCTTHPADLGHSRAASAPISVGPEGLPEPAWGLLAS